MVLALDLHPGHGLGPFSIGMTLSKAFVQIEQQAGVYDCAQVKYHDEEPLKFDVVISFPKHGFHLRFDAWSQGLSFDFPIPSEFAYWCDDREDDIPLELPNGTTPVTSRVLVYDSFGEHSKNARVSTVKACVPPLVDGSLYMEEVRVKLGEELWFTVGGQHITFGSSPQDVLTELGSPCKVHDEKQVIKW